MSSGPIKTLAAKAIAGDSAGPGAELDKLNTAWDGAAPIGWDVDDREPVAKTVCTVLGLVARHDRVDHLRRRRLPRDGRLVAPLLLRR
ncbi:hypothetical protein GCM10020255_081050 [Rhodococcus baikonurensis]